MGTLAPGLGLGPDSRFLRLEASCVYTHLDIPEVNVNHKSSNPKCVCTHLDIPQVVISKT